MQRKAPWPDFSGQPIHEGDWLEHPNGDRGRVAWSLDPKHDGVSRWRVVYANDESLWLGNQIGDKGRAVVVDRSGACDVHAITGADSSPSQAPGATAAETKPHAESST